MKNITFEEAESLELKLLCCDNRTSFKEDLKYYNMEYDESKELANNIDKFKDDNYNIIDNEYIVLKEN